MKKLIATLALGLGTAAFAQSAQQEPPPPSQSQVPKAEQRVGTGVDASEVGRGLNGGAKEAAAVNGQNDPYQKRHALDIQGKVTKADKDKVTIARTDLPDAKLDVKAQTAVTLDGKKIRADQIPEGSAVRAKFQLDGDDPIAVELKATSPKEKK
ncbi:hypothetical protein LZ198_38565 [Myxococcus sp. K15C18031901]|uniref:hypothetical protein n=1 Tax=Myxococcus dinghuensis TaxID=2906761 RepID=UPI0020A7DF8F|nr:hypothetical protein [Myxococcus dinghuensis]MCP3104785.1 hypothetical protein [Myxococcus dinghuensis]